MEKEFLADGRHMNMDSARHRVPHRHTLQVMEKGGTVEVIQDGIEKQKEEIAYFLEP
uniref:Uncharacterized protein n=1 Tax=Brugia malayi TaxID=6279 RepID=A8PPS7_BRUMA